MGSMIRSRERFATGLGVATVLAAAATAWVLGVAEAAPPSHPSDLAVVLEPIRKESGLPALGGAIVVGNDLVGLGATGVRRKGHDEKVTTADRWHLGSCTKAMTATLVARLVEKKDLAWDLSLEGAFPKLRKGMHADYRPVTLKLLLGNRGGAPKDLHADGLWGRLWKREGSPREQRMDLVRGVLPAAPAVDPGTKFLYSNAGFAIAGAAAETKKDRPWEDLLRAEVFDALGMEAAGFGLPGDAEKLDEPWGHRALGGAVPPGPMVDNPPAIGPAGTVHATLADWAKFVSLHLRGARGEKTGYLTPETFRTLHTPLDGQDYALGWKVLERKWAGGRVLTHSGSNTMWFCVTWIAPERNFAILVTSNQGGGPAAKACDQAVGALIKHHLGDR